MLHWCIRHLLDGHSIFTIGYRSLLITKKAVIYEPFGDARPGTKLGFCQLRPSLYICFDSLNKTFWSFSSINLRFSFFSTAISAFLKAFFAFSTSSSARFAIFPFTSRTIITLPFCATRPVSYFVPHAL